MRSGLMSCPTCGGGSIQDRATGNKVPWLIRQEAASRRTLSYVAIIGGAGIVAVGVFFAVLGFIADMGWFPLVFALVWGLIIARLGVGLIQTGAESLGSDPVELACLTCQTTWATNSTVITGPPTTPPSTPGTPSAPTSGPPIPRQTQAPDVETAPVRTPDVAQWEASIRESLSQEPANQSEAAQLEHARRDTVRVIAQSGERARATGTGDGRSAVETLVRLLDVDTGYLPELRVGQVHGTMRHEVIEQLGRSGDPAAVEPLIGVLTNELARYVDAAQHATGTAPLDAAAAPMDEPLRHSALAEDLYRTAAEALARLGDPRALPALHEAEPTVHFGMKKATRKAIQALEVRQPH